MDTKSKASSREKRIKQKKLLLQMKKEIKILEFEIKYFNLISGARKNLKISVKALQKVAPYVLTAGIIAGGFTLAGHTPFYSSDEKKVSSNAMTEIDDCEENRTIQQSDNFEVDENDLYSFLYVCITGLCEFVPLYFRRTISDFDFASSVEEIKYKSSDIDIDTLKKKLELKRENYNRLMR